MQRVYDQMAFIEARQAHLDDALNAWLDQLPMKYREYDIATILEKWTNRFPAGNLADIHKLLNRSYPGAFVLLKGVAGTGKTTTATAIVTELIQQYGGSGRFVNGMELLNRLSFDRAVLADLSGTDYLVIDDLGAVNEGITPHQQRSLWALIEARWSDHLLTIITTNMGIQTNELGVGLAEWVGPSAWDRIADQLLLIQTIGSSARGL